MNLLFIIPCMFLYFTVFICIPKKKKMYMNVLTFYKISTTLYITYNLIYLLNVIFLRFFYYGTFTINLCFNLDQ